MPGALYTADMAARQGSGSENDEFHSLSGQERDDVEEEQTVMEPPIHPVQSMQGAFEESITESTEGSRPRPSVDMTAEERRRKLLDSAQYDDSWTARWKQKKAARYHPCEKLVSQIIFGLHLLQQQQAKSEEEVVKILQTHVNEVDTFLEKTAEDFDLASNDIDERIRFLKLPMAHQDVFETMLDDKKFRTQLLDGNEKIVTIIDRTTKAMNASMLDIHKCIYANRELGKYLDKVQRNWPKGKRGIADVYGAMRGNEHGWTRYLKDLHTKGTTLGKNLVDLANLVGDMSKMAAEASKRSKRIINNGSKSAPSSPGLHSKFTDSPAPPMPTLPHSKSFDKPLPRQPNGQPIPTSNGTTKPHPVPFTDRYEKPRQPPQSPDLKATETPPLPRQDEDPPRPKTAGARFTPRQARAADSRSNTLDLMEFLKADNSKANNSHQNPLRSNPPEIVTPKPMLPKNSGRKLWRSQSQSADILVNPQPPAADPKAVGRSRSQGALDILKAADEAKAQAKAQIRAHTRAQPSSATSHRSSQDQGAGDRPSTDTSQSMRRYVAHTSFHISTGS